jgi:hypothetical protein
MRGSLAIGFISAFDGQRRFFFAAIDCMLHVLIYYSSPPLAQGARQVENQTGIGSLTERLLIFAGFTGGRLA